VWVGCVREREARVRFFNTVDLVNQLEAEAHAGKAGRLATRLSRADLALDGMPPEAVHRQLLDGLARLRAAGIDTVLMDTQPVQSPEREAAMGRMDRAVADAAREAGVALLPRHALMQSWLRSGRFAPATLLGPDWLHMTDASYRCLAEQAADLLPAPTPS
jgi:hypothetical protein